MFSQHEVIHMSKKTKDNAKKVPFEFSRQKYFILRICYVISTAYYLLVCLSLTRNATFFNGKKGDKNEDFQATTKKVFHNVKKPQDDD